MKLDSRDVERARAAAAEYANHVLKFPNVFGCGVGERTVGGRKTGEVSLVVFVERKLPPSALRSEDILPREVSTPDGKVLIDVVERARPRFGVDNTKYDPLRGGCQLTSAANGGSGTLGAVMYDRTDTEVVLLTCNHVLTVPGQRTYIPQNTRVGQPGMARPVGDVKRIVPFFRPPLGGMGNYQARVDAGIVALDPAVDAQFRVIGLGKHPYVVLPPSLGLEVTKRGFVSELTTGTVEEIDVVIPVTDFNGEILRVGGPGSGFTIRSAPGETFFVRGDSGSLVVDAQGGAARGIMFGGDFMAGGLSYACQISAIMEELQLETPCTGSLNAMFMRALRRRLMLQSLGVGGSVISSSTKALPAIALGVGDAPLSVTTKALTKNLGKFRFRYLQKGGEGSVACALEHMFRVLANELSEDLHLDDDFAGLMDLAIGDWLVQPTVYDMLEYRLPKDFHARLGHAFHRFRALHPEATGYEWVAQAFKGCAGARMRDVLTQRAPKLRRKDGDGDVRAPEDRAAPAATRGAQRRARG